MLFCLNLILLHNIQDILILYCNELKMLLMLNISYIPLYNSLYLYLMLEFNKLIIILLKSILNQNI